MVEVLAGNVTLLMVVREKRERERERERERNRLSPNSLPNLFH
jgi:hypothetical protein